MRELVAPATRWLLRLTLFLALLAWLQGQWYRIIVQLAPVGVGLTQAGYAIVLNNGGTTEFIVKSVDELPRLTEFYSFPSTIIEDAQPTGFQLAGVAVNYYSELAGGGINYPSGAVMLVGIRHSAVVCWLVILLVIYELILQRRRRRPVTKVD